MLVSMINPYKIIGALAFIALLSFSCNKEKDTTAIITIVDENNDPVPGAYVKLKGTPTFPIGDPTRLDQEMITDFAGQARFDYTGAYHQGQAGFAIMDIVSFKDSTVGEGIIKIIEEEESQETVVLIPIP